MKKLLICLIVLVMVVVGLAENDVKKSFKVTKGENLYVKLKTGGTIEISGWSKNVVAVTATIDGRDAKLVLFTAEKNGKDVELGTEYKERKRNLKCDVKLIVKVPKQFNLKLSTMGGRISIDDVSGEIKGNTMGGGLELSNLKGKLKMTTMGGKIKLVDSDVDGSVKTMGGSVLLENVVGDVNGKSMGGNVVYKNVTSRSGKSTGKMVSITTMGGSINLNEALNGAKVKTMGGKISIKKAKKFIQATTMGGDIDVDSIDGWIKAITMGGDVKVIMVGNAKKGDRHVDLRSMGGDVELIVPKGLSMEFDIELAYTKRSKQNYKIISDFDIKTKKTDEWETKKGSARKYIYGTGSVAGGKHVIKIKTINGNIYIKKG